jgi:hypothetical protein
LSIVSKNNFKPKVSAPISDNEKLNSFNFKQGTPCQSNNVNNVYGSKDRVHIKTKTLVDLNSIYYERSILPTTHQVIYIYIYNWGIHMVQCKQFKGKLGLHII